MRRDRAENCDWVRTELGGGQAVPPNGAGASQFPLTDRCSCALCMCVCTKRLALLLGLCYSEWHSQCSHHRPKMADRQRQPAWPPHISALSAIRVHREAVSSAQPK